jgi:hypothetical protein
VAPVVVQPVRVTAGSQQAVRLLNGDALHFQTYIQWVDT